jgi:dTDP-4-amino-4,6-dideoxygalactose transaminase
MRDDTEASVLKGPDMIPLLDLIPLHEELEEELVSVFRTALRHGRFSGGPMVEQFEADFGTFCGIFSALLVCGSSE